MKLLSTTPTITCLTLLSALPLAHGSALYFEALDDNLIITAREADNSAQYWSLTLSQGTTEGPKGAITGFYDLTGAPGSNSAFNIASGSSMLTTEVTGATPGMPIGSHANAALTLPGWADGATSFTFTVETTFPDYVGGAMATFSSEITINAPSYDGTRFDIINTLVTPVDWSSGGSFSEGGRESRSGLALKIQPVVGALLGSYDGWAESPKDPAQWASIGADGSTGYADGRSFYLTQISDLEPGSIGTAGAYHGAVADEDSILLTQMLSGVYRGNAPAGSTFGSHGYLDINIAAVPEPSTYAAIAGLGALGFAFYRRRKAQV